MLTWSLLLLFLHVRFIPYDKLLCYNFDIDAASFLKESRFYIHIVNIVATVASLLKRVEFSSKEFWTFLFSHLTRIDIRSLFLFVWVCNLHSELYTCVSADVMKIKWNSLANFTSRGLHHLKLNRSPQPARSWLFPLEKQKRQKSLERGGKLCSSKCSGVSCCTISQMCG